MPSKRALVIGGTAVAAVLAFVGLAKASEKSGGNGGTTPDEGPTPEDCATLKTQRNNRAQALAQLNQDQVQAEENALYAAQNGDDAAAAQYAAQAQYYAQQKAVVAGQIAQIDSALAECSQ